MINPNILFEDEGEESYPEPTSTDKNISSTFETGPLNKKDPIKRRKYYVKVISNDEATIKKRNNYQRDLKRVNDIHQKFIRGYQDQLHDRLYAAERAFLKFKYSHTIPSAFKRSADLLQNYYTDS